MSNGEDVLVKELSTPIERDPVLWEMLSPELRRLADMGPAAIADLVSQLAAKKLAVSKLNEELADLRAAIQKYADETGQGFLFHENVRLCLEMIKANRPPTFIQKP